MSGRTWSLAILVGLAAAEVRAAPRDVDAAVVVADRGGVPSLLWTPGAEAAPRGWSAEAVARRHLLRHREAYGVTRATVAGLRLRYVHDTGRGGIVVGLRPVVGGLAAIDGDVAVLLDESLRPLAISGTPLPAGRGRFVLADEDAAARALADVGEPAAVRRLAAAAGWTRFAAAGLQGPGRVRACVVPHAGALVSAYFVELPLADGRGLDLRQVVIAADDGRVLRRRGATAHAAYKYRVWADPSDRRPMDGPQQDFTPHPTGIPDGSSPNLVAPTLVMVDGLNTNPDALADPWLPENATSTRGNNVDAYADFNDPPGLDGTEYRADITSPGTFDRTHDASADPQASTTQVKSAITQLFYTANWQHDWWYDSGFDEAAGNAQTVNFGRGGEEGDAVLAEAQDRAKLGVRDDPSMTVPLDGEAPTLAVTISEGPMGAPFERDGAVDNLLVAHEWGHLLHRRLVVCGSPQCQAQGEGWGDFNALLMASRAGDDLHATYAVSSYATTASEAYFGPRWVPYSVEFSRDALTFGHIADGASLPQGHPLQDLGAPNSEPHNAGEVWATMLWDFHVALQEAHAGDLTFDEVRRRTADYVVAGMKLAPSDPTFTEQRDALRMAVLASDPADVEVLALAFARRGAGTCAAAPERYSQDFVGVVEDFELRGAGLLVGAWIDEGVSGCDGDDVLDLGEVGRISAQIFNKGDAPLPAGTMLEVVDPDPALMFADGPMLAVEAVPAGATVVVSFAVSLTAADGARPLDVTLRLTTPDGCPAVDERQIHTFVHADVAGSKIDMVDVDEAVWEVGDGPVWRREWGAEGGHFWHADEYGAPADVSLTSPVLQVADDAPLVVEFDHAYSFETSQDTFWGGGVVEVKRVDEVEWSDVAMFAPGIGYGGVVSNASSNPLGDRPAYVGESAGYPARAGESLDLGMAFAGQQIQLRFRVGSDEAVAAPGWDVDNVHVEGIVGLPFRAYVDEIEVCASDTTGGETTSGTTTQPATSSETTDGSASTTGSETTGSTPEPTTSVPTGGGEVGAEDSSGAGSSTTGTQPDEAGEGGCGCREATSGAGWLAGLLLGLRRRPARRRR